MDWENARMDCVLIPGNSFCSDWALYPSVVQELYTDPTLMASRWFVSASADTGLVEFLTGAAIGIGLIAWSGRFDTSVVGGPDTPLPLSDGNLDWILRYVLPIPSGYNPAADQLHGEAMWDNHHLSKAKRRLGQDHGILMVAESKQITNFWSINIDVRMLIKE